ncbi:transport permease protein [Sphaerisporangium rufum]|uniref:Transport permease protein n=1 Tax=Sphaerisporangium rufum TaxID=1381558 RepID=A0A919R652_9ACTN|nr:ABC transporter permease [Sphaerisporangium rufum]GII80406.1 transport permease protein [Sphaerisporangium rufum]
MTSTTGPAVTRPARRRTSAPLRLTVAEARLYLREPAVLFFTIILPLGLALVLGNFLPGMREPDPLMNGQRAVDTQLPVMMITLAAMTSAFTIVPGVLALYRERGVLRRMSVTPVPPALVLAVQLLLNVTISLLATLLMIAAVVLAFDSRPPAAPLWFAVSFLAGVVALFAIGLLLAAVVPGSRAAGGAGSVVMFPLLFLAGMWIPREHMPDGLRVASDISPGGAFGQALRDAWAGAAPQPLHLAVLLGWTLVAGLLAARLFRWE